MFAMVLMNLMMDMTCGIFAAYYVNLINFRDDKKLCKEKATN